MEGQTLDTVDSEKDLGIMISSDLKSSNQCIRACSKASNMLGMIKRTISCKKPEIMVRLYKTLVRPHLQYCVSVWQGCGLGLDVSVSRRISVLSRSRLDENCQCLGLVSVSATDVSCRRPIFRQILQVTIVKLIKSVVAVNKYFLHIVWLIVGMPWMRRLFHPAALMHSRIDWIKSEWPGRATFWISSD